MISQNFGTPGRNNSPPKPDIHIDPLSPSFLTDRMVSNTESVAQDQLSCRNCGLILQGQYCHDCGQKHFDGRLNTTAMVTQLFEALTESNSTIWQTLRKLIRNPGKVALQYIDGGRAQYLNPIRFLLVCFTIYFALMVITGAQVEIANRVTLFTSDDIVGVNTQLFLDYLKRVVAFQMDVIIFFTIPILALIVRWQYFRAHRNYAETFSFICFVFGLGYLLASILVPFQALLDMNSAYPKNIITGCLFVYGAKTFFEMSWPMSIFAGAVTAMAYFITMPIVSTIIAVIEIYIDTWL